MHRQFVTPAQLLQPELVLDRVVARHLQSVLRLTTGDTLELFDGAGRTVRARIAGADRQGLQLVHDAVPLLHPPPACILTLVVCISKGWRMDWTVEKAVELGVSHLLPVISARTIVRLDDDEAAADKVARWQRVALDAARQCGAVWLPQIVAPRPLAAALAERRAERSAPLLVAALTPAARPLRDVLAEFAAAPPTAASWIVGPEGDFTSAEHDLLLAAGALPVSLGSRVLRAETAALYGLCALNCAWI